MGGFLLLLLSTHVMNKSSTVSLILSLVILFSSPAAAAPIGEAVLIGDVFYSHLTKADYQGFAESVIGTPEVQQILGPGSRIVELHSGNDKIYYTVTGGKVFSANSNPGAPDFTIIVPPAAMLAIVNSDDPGTTAKAYISSGVMVINSRNPLEQAVIKLVLFTGAARTAAFAPGSKVSLGGISGILGSTEYFNKSLLRAKIGNDDVVFNQYGAPVGFLPGRFDLFSKPPASFGVYFNRPPGILAQNPGLIYDTTTHNPNVMGPHNVFKINPGLIGPDKILQLNPGLIGPADIALLNPNLHGAAEFAYAMGIGAHSRTAQHLQQNNLIPDRFNGQLGTSNRWGQTLGNNRGGRWP